MKTCCRCNQPKDESCFSKDKNRKDGLKPYCKMCASKENKKYYATHREYKHEYYEEHKDVALEQVKIYREENKQKISNQRRQYRENNKDKIAEQSRAYYQENKDDISDKHKIYNEENRDKILEQKHEYYEEHKGYKLAYQKEYDLSHKEEKQEYNKEYAQNHKEETREYHRNYSKARSKIDVNFRIANNLRSRLYGALKNNRKAGSAIDDLGCTIDELKLHLSDKFYIDIETGRAMNWDNCGTEWEIDHIIPLSILDLTDENQFCRACHYTNLQPLWSKDNLDKRASTAWDWE